MSAVLGIVRGHHGAILIDTALGRGTSIRVLFPVCEPESDLSPVVARNSPPLTESTGDHRKVLVADDEETVRHLFLRYMERLGFEGIGAADGEEAVALFEKHADSIAFVLLDLTMPRMDGVSTAKEIRRIRPDVRVLLASGYSEQDAVKRFAGEGLSGFIQKPCQLEDLQGKVAQVFQGLA
jgi:CheY-like chemotaxis protein